MSLAVIDEDVVKSQKSVLLGTHILPLLFWGQKIPQDLLLRLIFSFSRIPGVLWS